MNYKSISKFSEIVLVPFLSSLNCSKLVSLLYFCYYLLNHCSSFGVGPIGCCCLVRKAKSGYLCLDRLFYMFADFT